MEAKDQSSQAARGGIGAGAACSSAKSLAAWMPLASAEALSPRSVLGAARALAGGHSQGALAGDPWQLGGAFVIDTAGELVFAQRSARSGDHADPAALIEALERCQASD